MSKLLGCTTAFVVIAAAVAIASLVFNILIYVKLNNDNATPDTPASSTVSPVNPNNPSCPQNGDVSNSSAWLDASSRLLACIDESVDPCDDFYQFSCGKYIQETDLAGQSRAGIPPMDPPPSEGTYDEAQFNINIMIANYLTAADVGSLGSTEKIQKKFLEACYADGNATQTEEIVTTKFTNIKTEIENYLGFPLFKTNTKFATTDDVFKVLGQMERQFTGNPVMSSLVTADYNDGNKNALYVSQPQLAYPRDYYVLPQYIANLESYREDIEATLHAYQRQFKFEVTNGMCDGMNKTNIENFNHDCLTAVAGWVVDVERTIAMASWPETELRNYKQQYNPYVISDIDIRFPNIKMSAYVNALAYDVAPFNVTNDKIVLTTPTYFSAIDAIFASNDLSLSDYSNYIAIQFLMQITGDYGPDVSQIPHPTTTPNAFASRKDREPARLPPVLRRGHGTRRIAHRPASYSSFHTPEENLRSGCMNTLLNYMPYGPGYTYVKLRTDREKVRADIKTQTELIIESFGEMINSLQWMGDDTRAKAHEKSAKLVRNYGWPDWFGDFKDTKPVDDYNVEYNGILNSDDYWVLYKALYKGLQTTEMFKYLNQADGRDVMRKNFLSSPATVNAWYQPERNSITFPFGILNPPYYTLEYPQAYNYAGQGGTAGHELTHGYDDEGVQFGPTGELVSCTFTHCGIMDDDSRKGFVDMAQCVVTQYNGKCCPLKSGNIRCVNGATTQGENIADLGGQFAAYRAYAKWTEKNGKELLLKGLEKYTPNQIFWMTYGVSWCMKITDARLQKQLLTDPHSPSSCRVNQVMQDIPQFGRDFGCKRGTSLYPADEDRCKVWVGF